MRFLGAVLKGLTLLGLVTSAASAPPCKPAPKDPDYHWVPTWTSMPQMVEPRNLAPVPFTGAIQFNNATLRQTFRMTVGAERIRVQISNLFGATELPVTAATIALPEGGAAGVGAIDTETLAELTFGGETSVVLLPGEVIYSDPIDYPVESRSNLAVSLYLETGQAGGEITGHPGSWTTSWMVNGNAASAADVSAGSTVHWYFVTAVEIWAPSDTRAFVILGDSITDGHGSDDDGNNKWPDLLVDRMHAKNITNIPVANEAAGGNAVLAGGLGPPLLTRYHRDAFDQPGVKYIMIFIGVNDIGKGPQDAVGANAIADGLIEAFIKIVAEAKERGLVTIGATITPFTGEGQPYSGEEKEVARQKVNKWIREESEYDYVLDFDEWIGEEEVLKGEFNTGDHLHPNVAGFQELADRFPLEIFSA